MIAFFKNQKLLNSSSDALVIKLNQYARNIDYFGDGKVTDDPDGRFELITLFAVPYFLSISKRSEFGAKLAQKMFDKIFKGFDTALRRLGVSDVKVGERVRKLAEGFYGRQISYKNAIEKNDIEELTQKISLNVFSNSQENVEFQKILAEDVMKLFNSLEKMTLDEILK